LDKLFKIYLRELLEWNKKFNLTAIKDPEEIKIRHFEDSLSVLKALDLSGQSVLDIGPGAGFPGIPLKIVRPDIKLTLLESTRKKCEFLKHIIQVLDLKEVEVVWGRAGEWKAPKKFEVVLVRAVAKMPELVKWALPYLMTGGKFVALKQEEVEAEVENARENLGKFGGEVREIKKVEVAGIPRSLVVIEKIE
jgi:16S rRNA (guanine527-N7)-methyltransferase